VGTNLAEVSALIGDPARANILAALMDGRALTASELAYVAGVGASTTSAHLAKLHDANLLTVVKQGRHRYFRLASPLVSRMLEGIMTFAAIGSPPRYQPRTTNDAAMRLARTCYDHLAGWLGVALADALVARGHVVLGEDAGELTASPDGRDPSYACEVSCVDWYGNSRPLFVRGRVFALMGYEIVEGKVEERRIVETRRLNFAPAVLQVTR